MSQAYRVLDQASQIAADLTGDLSAVATVQDALVQLQQTRIPWTHRRGLAVASAPVGSPISSPGPIQITLQAATPIISFMADDGLSAAYTDLLPMFQAAGLVANVCLVTSTVGQGGIITWAQAREMEAAGWGVHVHGVQHLHTVTATAPATAHSPATVAEIIAEGPAAAQVMRDNGLHPTCWVYPYGETSDTVKQVAQQYFRAAVGVGPGNTANTLSSLDTFEVLRFGIDTSDLATAQAAVDACFANGQWLVFMLHPGNANWATLKTWLPALLTYIKGKGVPVLGLDDALDAYAPRLDMGRGDDRWRVAADGSLWFPGRVRSLSVGAMTPAMFIADPFVREHSTMIQFIGLAGDAGTPSGAGQAGLLITLQGSKQADRQYSGMQLWYPSGKAEIWQRWPNPANGTWQAWAKVSPQAIHKIVSATEGPWIPVETLQPAGTAGSSYTQRFSGNPWCAGIQAGDLLQIIPPTDLPLGLAYGAIAYANTGVDFWCSNTTNAAINAGNKLWRFIATSSV